MNKVKSAKNINRVALFDFVEQYCKMHNIDDSHGVIHSKRCVDWVDKMIENESEEEKIVAIYAAAIHDLCDKKYISAFESINQLKNWLSDQNENPLLHYDMIEAILVIIQTMSYSYLSQRKYSDDQNWYPDHGIWNKSYHLARHADLLEGYHVGRCYLYTKHAFSQLTEDEIWERVEELFKKRMYLYLSDQWITHPIALQYAPELEKEAKRCFQTRIWEYN
jgi:hypothetical protein